MRSKTKPVVEQGVGSESPVQDAAENQVQPAEAEVQVRVRASQRQGGGQPLHLGVHQRGQRQRADHSGTPPPLPGVRVWRQFLCPVAQPSRHNGSGQVRQPAQGKCAQSVGQTENQVWNKIDILDISSYCQSSNVIKMFQAQNSTPFVDRKRKVENIIVLRLDECSSL